MQDRRPLLEERKKCPRLPVTSEAKPAMGVWLPNEVSEGKKMSFHQEFQTHGWKEVRMQGRP